MCTCSFIKGLNLASTILTLVKIIKKEERIYNHKKLQYNKNILTNKRGLKRVYSAPLGNVNEFGTPRRLGYEKKKKHLHHDVEVGRARGQTGISSE